MAGVVAKQVAIQILPKLVEHELPFLLNQLDTSKVEASLANSLQNMKVKAPLSVPIFIDLWNRMNKVVQNELGSYVPPTPEESSWFGGKRREKRTRTRRNRK